MRMRIACAVVAVVVLAHPGCREKEPGPQTYPVSGEVRRAGKPAAGGTVQFVHQTEPGVRAVGEIGPDGAFTLFTLVGDEKRPGAAVGDYKAVLVFKSSDPIPPTAHPRGVFKVEAKENTFKIEIP